MAAVVQLAVKTIQKRHPGGKQVVLQSDNASGFASQELIPFIFNMNKQLGEQNKPVFTKWIYTEAQTGKSHLKTHFSYFNIKSNPMLKMATTS